jgi:uncharacterized protein (DUF1810 family)
MDEDFRLERFVEAQEPIYAQALAELRAGRKQSHWMWFIFPQLAGLGRSPIAQLYAIHSIAEARAYLRHPLLGNRLAECTAAILLHRGMRPQTILGDIDAAKFRSSMTLFEAAADALGPFSAALEAFHAGERDAETLRRLRGPELESTPS